MSSLSLDRGMSEDGIRRSKVDAREKLRRHSSIELRDALRGNAASATPARATTTNFLKRGKRTSFLPSFNFKSIMKRKTVMNKSFMMNEGGDGGDSGGGNNNTNATTTNTNNENYNRASITRATSSKGQWKGENQQQQMGPKRKTIMHRTASPSSLLPSMQKSKSTYPTSSSDYMAPDYKPPNITFSAGANQTTTTKRSSSGNPRERRMSRRARKNLMGAVKVKKGNTFVNADCPDSIRSNNSMKVEDSLSETILKSLSRERLCDVEVVGKDEVPVEVPGYLLAAHSEIFEEMFYSKKEKLTVCEKAAAAAADVEKANPASGEDYREDSGSSSSGEDDPSDSDDPPSHCEHHVKLKFATWDSINATVHFLATRTLPDRLERAANEHSLRTICQMHLIGRMFNLCALKDQAYRTARLIMNKTPRLVSVAFDECVLADSLLGEEFKRPSCKCPLKEYALEYLRESPLTTLLAEGTVFLSAESISAIMCDQEMDMDETTMFHVLNSWVKQDEECNRDTGRALVSNIDLAYIKTEYLNNVVRKSGFVDASDVDAALKEIEEMLENQSPDEKEHVVVEGAGKPEYNGIYVRQEEDIGLGEDEVVYVKECREDEDYCPDYGLYLMKARWALTPCVDSSNFLYSREAVNLSQNRHIPPKEGWKTVGGVDPPPTLAWNAAKDGDKAGGGNRAYLAPNLAGSGTSIMSIMDVANGDHDEGRKRISLNTMLNLPTDEGHEEDDYHDDMDDSIMSMERESMLSTIQDCGMDESER